MKQFNLDEYLKNPSRKVVTRDGRNVRIVCTNKKGVDPIVALVTKYDSDTELAYTYAKNGEFVGSIITKYDLFFAPEKHEGWVNVHKVDNSPYLDTCIWPTEEYAKKGAKYTDNYVATVKIEWEE